MTDKGVTVVWFASKDQILEVAIAALYINLMNSYIEFLKLNEESDMVDHPEYCLGHRIEKGGVKSVTVLSKLERKIVLVDISCIGQTMHCLLLV